MKGPPRERRKKENCGGEVKKKRKILAPGPTLRGPTLGVTVLGPDRFRPTLNTTLGLTALGPIQFRPGLKIPSQAQSVLDQI